MFVASDSSVVLSKGIIEGRLDIACCFSLNKFSADLRPFLVAEKEDRLVWVYSKEFVLSPGQPVPIVTWPGDEWMTQSLSSYGIRMKSFSTAKATRLEKALAEASLALMVLPSRLVPSSLVRAKEYYLPQLPSISLALYISSRSLTPRMIAIRKQLQELFFESN